MATDIPPPQLWPSVRARDARGLIRFLTDAFGFEELVVHGEGDRVDHAELVWPLGGGVMLGSLREDAPKGGLAPGSLSAYVVTDAPDELCARARERGAEILVEPHDTAHGSRDFGARDPEGNHWFFGTYRGASWS